MALLTAAPVYLNLAGWDTFVAAHPDGHTLQTADWGRLKSSFGWSAEIVSVTDSTGAILAGAQILFRQLPLKLGTMGYIPAGPLFALDANGTAKTEPAHPTNQQLWQTIAAAARRHHAAFLKVEPCNWYRPRPDLPAQLEYAGLQTSPQTIQPPRTMVLDISDDEAAILGRMNQSTRYKCKLREKKEIEVREGSSADVASFNALMGVTGDRDAFGIHAPAYYQKAFDLFAADQRCALLLASYQGRDLAGMMVWHCGENAYYLYGASSNEERNRMPTYILQLEAIRWAKRHGAIRYDLWGVPDADEAVLEALFEQRHDGLWGVYGFKRGFGGRIVRSVGAWDKVYNPAVYAAYRWYLNRRKHDQQ